MTTGILFSRITPHLPAQIRKPLGHIRRTIETPFSYLRGRKILTNYTKYYREAQRIFIHEGNSPHFVITPPKDIGVRVIFLDSAKGFISLPPNYPQLVKRVAASVEALFDRTDECSLFPQPPVGSVPQRLDETLATKNGEVISIQLKNPLATDGLEDLCSPIIQELENKVYGSYSIVERVYIYRSPVSHQARQVSWLWHYDNHPHEILKVMIYLTDVSDCSAPFEYLRSRESLTAVSGSPVAPLFGHSRISDEVLTRHLSNGAEPCRITGPAGTMIIFDNNMIHKANLALEGYRDVLILQVRPIGTKTPRYIDPQWTGSFQHAPFNLDPRDLKPSIAEPGAPG